jgi:nitrogen fixation protein NifB
MLTVAMELGDDVRAALETHPCYNEEAHRKFARMHLPVAPRCNIQCNYCNRKYDCSNESRPGVTSEVLTPQQALEKVRAVKEKIPELKVVAIAGPGDPLANEETFTTFDLVRKEFPEMTLCVSTNGLMLPQYAEKLHDLGIRFLTVTMNASDPEVSKDIYSAVIWNGKKLTGRIAAEKLLECQMEGIRKCVSLGMAVKINIVMIPGINDEHIPALVKQLKSMGVYIVNILPLIPVEGTRFQNRPAPTPEERKALMDLCSADARMMRHCRQCRADAIGLLDNDRSQEFVMAGACGEGCGGRYRSNVELHTDLLNGEKKVAVASEDGKTVDCGFGNTKMFRIYASDGMITRFLKEVRIDTSEEVYGRQHSEHIARILDSLDGCDAVAVREIGHRPEEELKARGKKLLITDGPVEEAAIKAARL